MKGCIIMKTKIIRGTEVNYAESGKELRSFLATCPTQLLAQPGSAIAITTFAGICPTTKELADFLQEMPISVRQSTLLLNMRILVQHRTDNNLYSLIGGARKLTESFEATAYRELGEETGLELSDLLFMGMVSGGDNMINIYPDGNAAEGLDALFFAVVPHGSVLRKNSETREFRYMTIDEIIENLPNWHPAQTSTINLLLKKILQIPELYSLQNAELPAWNF